MDFDEFDNMNLLALDISNMPMIQSPHGKVLGDINPNSIRAHSSRKKSGRKTPQSNQRRRTPKSKQKNSFSIHTDDNTTSNNHNNDTSSPSTSTSRRSTKISSPTEEFDTITRGGRLFIDIDQDVSASGTNFSNNSTTTTTSSANKRRPLSAKSTFTSNIFKSSSPSSKLSKLPSSTTKQFIKSPPIKTAISRTSLASAPALKTPSPPSGIMSKKAMQQRHVQQQLPLSLGGRYSSPTDSTFSPVTTAMITGVDRSLNPRKAMAKRNLAMARHQEKNNTSMESKSSQHKQEEDELSVIIPLPGKTKYVRSNSSSSLPSLSLGMKKNERMKLFSPTDSVFSPVSSNFYKRTVGPNGKLEKMNARKAIFLRQNKK